MVSAFPRGAIEVMSDFVPNFFLFSSVQLFADFEFLMKLLVQEVPPVTEQINEVTTDVF